MELEAYIAVLSSHSSDPEVWDPPSLGKIPEEIAAWCAEYERNNRRIRLECQRAGLAGIYHATLVYLTCTDALLAAIRAMAAQVSTPQTLARKRSKGCAVYAPRTVAAGPSATSSDDEEVTVLNETGAPPAFHGAYLH